jgi:hypothetical protein
VEQFRPHRLVGGAHCFGGVVVGLIRPCLELTNEEARFRYAALSSAGPALIGKVYLASLRVPLWLASNAWELRLFRAQSGWDMKFRTYPVVPDDSKAFECIRMNNLDGLLQLFQRSEASPFDRRSSGWTLLHVSFTYGLSGVSLRGIGSMFMPSIENV